MNAKDVPQIGCWANSIGHQPKNGQVKVVKSSGRIQSAQDCERLCSWFENNRRWDYASCREHCSGHPISTRDSRDNAIRDETPKRNGKIDCACGCGKRFNPNGRQVYFDIKCRVSIGNRKRMPFVVLTCICIKCGIEFSQARCGPARTICDACRKLHRRAMGRAYDKRRRVREELMKDEHALS